MRVLLAVSILTFAAGAAMVTDPADARKSTRAVKGKTYYGYRAPQYVEDQADCDRANAVDPTRQYDLPCWARFALSSKRQRR